MVEGRVEDRHLGHVREGLHRSADAQRVGGIVQGGVHREGLDVMEHLFRDQDRIAIFRSSMHDAVAHGMDGCVV